MTTQLPSTGAEAPGVVALPDTFGKIFKISANGQLLRFGVTAALLTSDQLAAVSTANASKRIGKMTLDATANRKMWYRHRADGGYDFHLDDTAAPASWESLWASTLPSLATLLNRSTTTKIALPRYYPTGVQVDSTHWAIPFGGIGHDPVFLSRGLTDVTSTGVLWATHGGGIRVTDGSRAWMLAGEAATGVTQCWSWYANAQSVQGPEVAVGWYNNGAGGTALYASLSGTPLQPSTAAYTGDYATYAAEIAALFGVAQGASVNTPTVYYQNYATPAYGDVFTRPAGKGWIPILGLYFHGIHPAIKAFSVVDGAVTFVGCETTGNSLATFLRLMKSYVSSTYTASLESTATSIASAVGSKPIRIPWFETAVGPYDIYESAQIAYAIDQGASTSDIDSVSVSGVKCSTWRANGKAAPAATAVPYVMGTDYASLHYVTAERTGATSVTVTPDVSMLAAGTTIILGDCLSGYASGSTTSFASSDDMVALVQDAYPDLTVLYGSATEASIAQLTSCSWLDDLPFTWWQGLAMTDMSTVATSYMSAALVPGA